MKLIELKWLDKLIHSYKLKWLEVLENYAMKRVKPIVVFVSLCYSLAKQ